MTKQILFIQGGGANVHDTWDDKLVASLESELGQGYDVRYPRMPEESDPRFESWRTALDLEIAGLDAGGALVGHSVGATVLIHTVAEKPVLLKHIVSVHLIAPPFIGPGGWPSDDIAAKPDLGARLPEDCAVFLYQGDTDAIVPPAHVELWARALPQAKVRVWAGRDHQLNNDLSEVARDIERVTPR